MPKTFVSFLALLAALLFTVVTSHAESVRWEPASGTLALNQLSELSLVFDQCEPTGTVSLPAVKGLTFGSSNRSENTAFSVINGNASRTRTVRLTYRVRPTERSPITIPAFSVDTDNGRQRVASVTFQVGDATLGDSGQALSDIATANFKLPATPPWQGQVFDLHYNLHIRGNRPFDAANDFVWNADPLITEPWDRPQQTQIVQSGQPVTVTTQSTRAFARTAGTHRLAPSEQTVIIATSQDMFGRPTGMRFTITAPGADLTVKPLPTPAPTGFNGAVGEFTLDSKVVPATAAVGEPITWTLTLEGTGNWPDIPGLPSRSVSKDFTPITPQAKRVNKEGALFDASLTEDVVLIPTKPGRYTLGPVSYTFFNPTKGAYETLTTQPVSLQITPAAGQPTPAGSGSTSASDNEPTPDPSPANATRDIDPKVGAIPRDPLPPAGTAVAPFSQRTVFGAALSAVFLPLGAWLIFAFRRARDTDPSRPRREARIRISATLRQLDTAPRSSGSAELVSLLQAWQRDTSILWNLSQAVPTPASFRPSSVAASASERSAHSDDWAALWSDAECTLYGAAPLPDDWNARARRALDNHRVPAFSPFQLFHPRNLIPVALLLLSLGTTPSVFAADPIEAYASADFSAAETAWRESIKNAPTDWTAHHNLALTLIQQNRPGEAAGHALAAFVQQSNNPSVRWHLEYAFKTAGVNPAALRPFLAETPSGLLARLASPTHWQAILIASAWFAALAVSIGVHGAYKKRSRARLALCLFALALLLGSIAVVSLHTYRPLSDSHAVVVTKASTLRSIPSDLDTQKTTPLPLGAVAISDKTFLGWRHLTFPDGQTGWARADTLVPLWK